VKTSGRAGADVPDLSGGAGSSQAVTKRKQNARALALLINEYLENEACLDRTTDFILINLRHPSRVIFCQRVQRARTAARAPHRQHPVSILSLLRFS
jgi:hypothetical protein